MTDVQAHRGPDDEGFFLHNSVGLGHRRLSILDLSPAGHQPMASADGRYVIVYNGEIYNYIELRSELQSHGAVFRSQSDTEVILEAYRRWGTDCVRRFNGMWAFALYDEQMQEIFLSRDRFGIKPLYYLYDGQELLFASEIKAILAVRPEERQVNLPYVSHHLPGGLFDDGHETFFRNVRALLPAHNAMYRLSDARLRVWRYWEVECERFRQESLRGDPVEILADLLRSAVGLHLRSDVAVGTCLSGGVDSSSIVCLMSGLLNTPVHTFSALYEDRDCDERAYVAAVNGHVSTVPHLVLPDPHGDLLDDLSRITWHQDEPTAGPGLYTQYHVMKAVHGNVKVILDGQGGDELFAGYLWYLPTHYRDLWRCGWFGKLRALTLGIAYLRHWGGPELARALASMLCGRSKARSPSEIRHASLLSRVDGREVQRASIPQERSGLATLLRTQLTRDSIPALLHYEDRNSMAFSVEARVPLLDYRIVEFALGLDTQYKIRGTWTKWVLRKAAGPVLPSSVARRRSKMGYPTPMARWLRRPAEREQVREVIFSKAFAERELVAPQALRVLWDQHQSGYADHSWVLYRLLVLELWHSMYIDGWRPHQANAR